MAAERAAGATTGPILAANGSNYGTWIQGLQKSHPGPILQNAIRGRTTPLTNPALQSPVYYIVEKTAKLESFQILRDELTSLVIPHPHPGVRPMNWDETDIDKKTEKTEKYQFY